MRSCYDIIKRPIITEASMDMAANKKYVFEVMKDATKAEIATAVEEAFKVEVADVNTINMKRKPKRMGCSCRVHLRLEKGDCNPHRKIEHH